LLTVHFASFHSEIGIDNRSNIVIKNKTFIGTKDLFELMTRNKIQRNGITSHDLNKYKKILELTSASLEHNDPTRLIKIGRSRKYGEFIARQFTSDNRRRGVESSLRRKWISYK
jgi:hypothetical protein